MSEPTDRITLTVDFDGDVVEPYLMIDALLGLRGVARVNVGDSEDLSTL
jgi:hypothetical protein